MNNDNTPSDKNRGPQGSETTKFLFADDLCPDFAVIDSNAKSEGTLAVGFAHCFTDEASRYVFALRYVAGPLTEADVLELLSQLNGASGGIPSKWRPENGTC
jgi:hypothetical protein